MSEISITQGLAELKLLKSRIEHALKDCEFIVLRTKARPVDAAEFSTRARASYQSYRDLCARYDAIKSAIVISNAVTRVTVAGREYTVAEAIERKRTILTHKAFIANLQSEYKRVHDAFARHTNDIQSRAERLLEVELGKESKTNVENSTQFVESFLRSNKAEIVDPLKLETLIVEQTKEIQDFETTVDWVLSESNGRTRITI